MPVTVHVAIGTDIIHMHPSADGAAIGETSLRDFRLLAEQVGALQGGVYVNLGSAVILPEVFVKALNLARNVGHDVCRSVHARHGLQSSLSPAHQRRVAADCARRARHASHRPSRDHVPAALRRASRGDGKPVSPARKVRLAARPEPMPPIVTLLTDFGERDGFVGIMKGVVLGIVPARASWTHPRSRAAGRDGRRARATQRRRPLSARDDSLAVVDPGVGTARRPILIETERFILIGPDNGLLSLAAEQAPVRRLVHLDRAQRFLPSPSHTFHGRDVFAAGGGGTAPAASTAAISAPGSTHSSGSHCRRRAGSTARSRHR